MSCVTFVTYWELCIVSRWPSIYNWVGFALPQLAQIDLSCVDVPLNAKQTNKQSHPDPSKFVSSDMPSCRHAVAPPAPTMGHGARWGRKVPFWWRREVHHTSIHGALQNPFVDALNLEAELKGLPAIIGLYNTCTADVRINPYMLLTFVLKGAGLKLSPRCFSASGLAKNTIPTATTRVFEANLYNGAIILTLPGETRSQKSKMAAEIMYRISAYKHDNKENVGNQRCWPLTGST